MNVLSATELYIYKWLTCKFYVYSTMKTNLWVRVAYITGAVFNVALFEPDNTMS